MSLFYRLNYSDWMQKTRNLAVSLGRAPVFAVVKSNAGEHYLLGMESAGRATEGTASLGVFNGRYERSEYEFYIQVKERNVLG